MPSYDELNVDLGSLERFMDLILRVAAEGVIVTMKGTWVMLEVSESFCRMVGHSKAELLGWTATEVGLLDPVLSQEWLELADLPNPVPYQTRLRCRDGSERIVELTPHVLGDELILSIVRDVEQRVAADSDSVTGLLDRRHFTALAESRLQDVDSGTTPHSLLLVDVDGLPQINDRYGRLAGDGVLKVVAQTLTYVVADSAIVSRLDGGSFAALLSCDGAQADDAANEVTSRVQSELAAVQGEIAVYAAVAAASKSRTMLKDLMSAADNALSARRGPHSAAAAASRPDVLIAD